MSNVMSPIRIVRRSQRRAVAASSCEANTQNSADRGIPLLLQFPKICDPMIPSRLLGYTLLNNGALVRKRHEREYRQQSGFPMGGRPTGELTATKRTPAV